MAHRRCLFCCGGGTGSKALRACAITTILASPSTKAFFLAPTLTSAIGHMRSAASASGAKICHHLRSNNTRVACHSSRALRISHRRSLASLFAANTDGAKDAAMAAVQAAEEALDRETEAAGAAAGAREVQAAVAAARTAARNAINSLRGDGLGLGGEGGWDGQDTFRARQDVVTSPARSAVEAALLAMAEAQAFNPAPATAPSSAAAQDAISLVQAALDRRDSAASAAALAAAAEAGAVSTEITPASADPSPPPPPPRGQSGGTTEGGDGDVDGEEGPTKEPESARWSRNNPVASHSHMAHLLWRQVAGPGDTALDCTAGNGYDSLELAKTIALKDGLGSLYVIDVQERALEATRERLRCELGELALKRSTLINGNFRDMPAELEPMSVQLVVYNLGWLPGGDKSITTKLEDTLESIAAAQPLVKHGGMISVMLYRGHAEGKRESDAVRAYAAGLPHSQWRVFVHERINRPDAPTLVTIYRL